MGPSCLKIVIYIENYPQKSKTTLALTLTRCVLRTLLEQGLHARVRGLRQLDHLGT